MSFAIEKFYLLFQGTLVFQGIFFCLIWAATRRKDVFWYSLYLLTAALYFFVNATGTFFNIDENAVFESRWYSWLNIPIIIAENLFYLLFIRAFFYDIIESQRVKNILRLTLYSVPLLFFCFFVFKTTGISTYNFFYIVKLLSVIPAIFIVYIVIKNKLPYAMLVANGLVFTIIGTLLTVLMIILGNKDVHNIFTDYYPLFFIRLGILGDMFFYQLALLKKWRWQEKELAIQQLETQLAVERVKSQISKELHDDIGTTLSGINMYSHMAKEQTASGNAAASGKTLEVIQQASDEMINKLKDMVWAMQPGNERLEELTDKIKEYAVFISGAKKITLQTDFAKGTHGFTLSAETIHNVYTIAKEALNNAVKYSGASLISIETEINNDRFTLRIMDDGTGFDREQATGGNGLLNMQKRADDMGADFSIQSRPGEGCSISLILKITQLGIV